VKRNNEVRIEAKLCEHAEQLASYLNTDIDPYDFQYMLEKYVEGGPYLDRPEHPELAGAESVEELTEAQQEDFKEFLMAHVGYMMAADPLGVPAYLYFERAKVLPHGAWLVHFSRDSFLSFKKGATLETLALSKHRKAKTLTSCEANLDPESGLYDTVWGFAIEAEGLRHGALRDMKNYGDQVMLFQTDCAVSVWHTTDDYGQVIFPLCSEYNVHRGSYDGHVLNFDMADGDGDFDSLDDVIEFAEAGKLVPNVRSGARVAIAETYPATGKMLPEHMRVYGVRKTVQGISVIEVSETWYFSPDLRVSANRQYKSEGAAENGWIVMDELHPHLGHSDHISTKPEALRLMVEWAARLRREEIP